MKLVKKKLADLKSPERNLRLHTDKQIKEFIRSVEMFGQIRPLVVDDQNVILAGNGLHETLKQLGWTEADCYVASGLTDAQKKKLMMADNRIFDLGVDDMAAFDAFILELKDDLDIPGFDEDMLKSFVMDAPDADALLSGYGLVSDERAGEMRDVRERYEERDAAAAQGAEQENPGSGPTNGNDANLTFILCPKCGERIWR